MARVGPGNGPARSAGGGLDEGNEADRPQTSRLYPIWDSVVSQVLGTERSHLNPVREALRADDGALHRRWLSIREEAGLPEEISALRVFDVIAWMDGENRGLGRRADQER